MRTLKTANSALHVGPIGETVNKRRKRLQGCLQKFPKIFDRHFFKVVTHGVIASMYLLALSARTLPIGTAYVVWVGIGAFGTVVLGMAYLGEPANAGRVFFLILLMVATIGLKLAAH